MTTTQRKSAARERILETAEQLFYQEGVRAVGIDRIIAESNVAKMTLYNHFASKDALILEVLRQREERFSAMLEKRMERHRQKGSGPLDAFFAALRDWISSDDFRGCAFINATVELADAGHDATQFSAEHKKRFLQLLNELIQESHGKKATSATSAVYLLVEGAIVTALIQGSAKPAKTAHDAALTLIAKAKRR